MPSNSAGGWLRDLSTALGWGARTSDPRLFNRQIHAAARVGPLGNTAHAVSIVLVGIYVIPDSLGTFRALWVLAGLAICAATIVTWLPLARLPVLPNPRLTCAQMIVATALFAALWAVVAAVCFPVVETSRMALLSTVITGVIGCGAGNLSTSRAMGLTWVLTISVGAGTVAILQPDPTMQLLAMYLLLYLVAISLSVVYLSASFTARCLAEYRAEEEQQKVGLLLSEFEGGSRDWLWETGPDDKLSHVSPRFAEASSLGESRIRQLGLVELLETLGAGREPDGSAALARLQEHLLAGTEFHGVVFPLLIGGRRHWWSISGTPADGTATGWRGVGSDFTEAKEAQERIDRIATTDSVTGLPNRYAFNLALAGRLADGAAGPLYLAILDLDNFKAVNDTLGHPVGDGLIAAVAARLQAELAQDEFCARLGGDEFAIVVGGGAARVGEEATSPHAHHRFQHFRTLLKATPFDVAGNRIEITGSVGYAGSNQIDGLAADSLIVAADLALYAAKDAGRDAVCLYTDQLQAVATERAQLLRDLSVGLAQEQFELHCQPQIDIENGELTGFEALIRWRHPRRGLLAPNAFIAVAEETGLIVPLGRQVIRMALAVAVTLPTRVRMSVNVAPAELLSVGFAVGLAESLQISGLPPERLVVEVTETALLRQESRATLTEIKNLGVAISLDDFGTGYSSLAQLQQMPVDELKIDRSFVQRITEPDGVGVAIVRSVVDLARALGLRTVAEGVETTDQWKVLQQLGCDDFQGYLEARPMPVTQMHRYLAGRPVRAFSSGAP